MTTDSFRIGGVFRCCLDAIPDLTTYQTKGMDA